MSEVAEPHPDDSEPQRERVLVLGGGSEIAGAIVAELQARRPVQALLAGRREDALEAAARPLRERGARVEVMGGVDALDRAGHRAAIQRAFDQLGEVDVVLLALGVLGERGGLPDDISNAVEVLDVNLVGAGSLLLESAAALRREGRGTIVVLSSIAAERARRANVVYGASKAGLDALAQGLADALHGVVRVVVVRPGFVETTMTRGLARPPLACSPQEVARVTVRALEGERQTVWAPPTLRAAAIAMRLMPRALFRRMSF
ncbi:MAG: SDR family NAD(P)-dependent oxidoreductase [Solirubrobacterales bacterium]|nr:SDR family NAD(P)-dependent oxidoreductase [Solirubrobacterales bacterium]